MSRARIASLKLLPKGSSIPHNASYQSSKEEPMTRTSIRELVEGWQPRYLKASRKEKSRILDEFVALTGYHRKSAIRLLRRGYRPKHLDRRGRPRLYTPGVKGKQLSFRSGRPVGTSAPSVWPPFSLRSWPCSSGRGSLQSGRRRKGSF